MQRGLPCGQLRHGTRFTTCNPLETLTRHFYKEWSRFRKKKKTDMMTRRISLSLEMFGQTRNGGRVVAGRKKTGVEARGLKMSRISHPLHLLTQTFVLEIKVCSLVQHL